jgi:hypothetical protein
MEQKATSLFPIPPSGQPTPRLASELVPVSQIIPSCIKISRRRLHQLESISLIRQQRHPAATNSPINA